jgi:hypothetical protein
VGFPLCHLMHNSHLFQPPDEQPLSQESFIRIWIQFLLLPWKQTVCTPSCEDSDLEAYSLDTLNTKS